MCCEANKYDTLSLVYTVNLYLRTLTDIKLLTLFQALLHLLLLISPSRCFDAPRYTLSSHILTRLFVLLPPPLSSPIYAYYFFFLQRLPFTHISITKNPPKHRLESPLLQILIGDSHRKGTTHSKGERRRKKKKKRCAAR